MKVLFVCSGNNERKGPNTVVKNQAESLKKLGIEVEFYCIVGQGAFGYLKNVPLLRKQLATHNYDCVHAHYADSAAVATLAGAQPLVVSLMGTDALESKKGKIFIRLLNFWWKKIIVKTEQMKKAVRIKNVEILANGVDLDLYLPKDRMVMKRELGWDLDKKQILFMADPERLEKNFALAEQAFKLLDEIRVELKIVHGIPHSDTFRYYYAADALLMTSLHEGSPNVVKEAMACNLPIICTDVGDVRHLIGGLSNCFVTGYDAKEIAQAISAVLKQNQVSDGRERLIALKLSSNEVASRLKSIYEKVGN